MLALSLSENSSNNHDGYTKSLMVGSKYSVDMLDRGIIHVPARKEWDSLRFHHATQNSVQYKIYKLFTSGISHLIFSDLNWPQVTETMESETAGKRGLLY